MYTTVTDAKGAVDAATRLAAASSTSSAGDPAAGDAVPLLVDRVMAEAGLVEPRLAWRAITQAAGDLARATSLLRAWAANLERAEHTLVRRGDLRVLRRITPGFRAPPDGQYLGATFDYAQRLLDLGDDAAGDPSTTAEVSTNGRLLPRTFHRALEDLEREGLVDPGEWSVPEDRSRTHLGAGSGRGPFLQHLARSDTGAMTGLAYSALRGLSRGADPTLVELLRARAPVRRTHPLTGQAVRIGEITVTTAEIAMYRIDGGQPDPRFTLGVGATVGEVEVRAVAAALLDGVVNRANRRSGDTTTPSGGADDEEYVLLTLDQSEAVGFTEHLKLPHHVTFSSDIDAVRRVRDGVSMGEEER